MALHRQKQALNAQAARVSFHASKPAPTRLRVGGLNWTDTKTAIEFARTRDLVIWLVHNEVERSQLTSIVDDISRIAGQVLLDFAGDHNIRLRLGDHFWCDVVASIVVALSRIGDKLDPDVALKAAPLVWDLLGQSRARSHGYRPIVNEGERPSRAELDEAAGLASDERLAVLRDATTEIVHATSFVLANGLDTLDPILLKLRVLAVLLCPDPCRHKLVWDNCLVPLFQGPISSELQQRLTTLLPGLVQPLSWDG